MPQACIFIKKETLYTGEFSETLAQVFYYEFCEISKNTFFKGHLRWLLLLILEADSGDGP